MLKSEFFLAACKAECYKRKDWIISAFALIRENPDAWKTEPYPYRIVHMPTGMWFVDPSNSTNLIQLDDVPGNKAIFEFKEKITLKPNDLPNVHKAPTTTYGNVLVNWIVAVYPFGDKFDFLTGKINAGEMEKRIIPRFKDTPKANESRKREDIYVDEYLKFTEGMFFLTGLTQLCVPAGSRKSMTAPDGIVELRKKLVEENKDRLHDPATIAKIDKALVDYDKNVWMKDDPAADFLISGKAYNVVRRKLFLQMGAEQGLEEKVDVDYIQNSLSEGWDISKFPAMNNSLRAGSFNRGAQTMLGGESVKWLLRASSNMAVTMDDCKSRLGNKVVIDQEDKHKWLGFSVVTSDGHEKITEETLGKYLGDTVLLRSPMYCKAEKTDYCAVCVGDRLAANPTALSAAVAEYGSAFLSIYMSAAHGKALLLAKMDFKTAIQ